MGTNPRSENANSRQYLDSIMETMHNQLKMVQHAPSVQMQDMPNSSTNNLRVDMEDILDADERTNDIEEERRGAEHDAEFYDGDADQDGDSSNPPVRNNIGQGGSNSSVGGVGANSGAGNNGNGSSGTTTPNPIGNS